MGIGDEIIGSGLAKGLKAQGKRAAFGDGKRILWGPWCEEVYRHNPNVAPPGSEGSPDLHWVDYYKGRRHYNTLDRAHGKWIWNYEFRVRPGEIHGLEPKAGDFIYIEPNVPWHKSVAVNKDWGWLNYQTVADRLREDGYDVVQSDYGKVRLRGVRVVKTPTFRDALSFLAGARTALLPEGGMHHAAAALRVPAVVIFGGFIPPAVMGYEGHINLTGGAEACGALNKCIHCRYAMGKITVEEVYHAIQTQIAKNKETKESAPS